MAHFDILVIGAGLIGSAASRYLSASGVRVGVIGPAEPIQRRAHNGVFASHYDQGRITRIIDADPVWAGWAQRSIAAYPKIARQSGINFHVKSGGLYLVSRPDDRESKEERLHANGAALGAEYVGMDGDELAGQFPFLRFPSSFAGVWERGEAGYINPRSLVQAQLTIAQQQGAQILRETALSVSDSGDGLIVETDLSNRYTADKVLVAAGGFANCHTLLMERQLAYTAKLRTILLAEVDASEAERLQAMPTLICPVLEDPKLLSIYVLPPIRYPDGKLYIKLGGNNEPEYHAHSLADLQEWFRSEGNMDDGDHLRAALHALIPSLAARSYSTRPCVVTYTAHGYPYLDEVIPQRLFVAAGGCGSAAKSSDAIGQDAAQLLTGQQAPPTHCPAHWV